MAAKNPFDYSEMFKAFNPEEVAKMFSPARMVSMMESQKAQGFDMSALMETNRKNFEAMADANKAAAAAYKDLLEKQMDVFGQLTAAARENADLSTATGPDGMAKQTEAYGAAVEKALGLMRKLAENARDANQEAFAAMTHQIQAAIDELAKASAK